MIIFLKLTSRSHNFCHIPCNWMIQIVTEHSCVLLCVSRYHAPPLSLKHALEAQALIKPDFANILENSRWNTKRWTFKRVIYWEWMARAPQNVWFTIKAFECNWICVSIIFIREVMMFLRSGSICKHILPFLSRICRYALRGSLWVPTRYPPRIKFE